MRVNINSLRVAVSAIALLTSFSGVTLAQKSGVVCETIHGVLLAESKNGWQTVAAKSAAPTNQMLVSLFGAEFKCAGGAVEAVLTAGVGQRGPFPVLEAAAQFHANAKKDLDISLDRGILILTNSKAKGAAHIVVRVGDEQFDVELAEPKSKLGIEVYGRHVPGTANLKSIKDDMPVLNVAFLALAGDVVVANEKTATRLHAPPGPALYLWDNLTRTPDVHRFDTLPDAVKPMSAEEKQKFEKLAGFAKAWAKQPAAAIAKAVHSADPVERKAAVVALGATDDIAGLMKALTDKDNADVREMAVLALRHWMGRGAGQSIRLHTHLTKTEGLTPTQGKNLLYLLNGIEESKRKLPETYDVLIHALNHSKPAARVLAHWHLVRLAPDGKAIAYDAMADEPARLQGVAQWRKLIPEGEVPAPPKEKK